MVCVCETVYACTRVYVQDDMLDLSLDQFSAFQCCLLKFYFILFYSCPYNKLRLMFNAYLLGCFESHVLSRINLSSDKKESVNDRKQQRTY